MVHFSAAGIKIFTLSLLNFVIMRLRNDDNSMVTVQEEMDGPMRQVLNNLLDAARQECTSSMEAALILEKNLVLRLAGEIQLRCMLEAKDEDAGSERHKIATWRLIYERIAT